ncbi:hypothetical protein LXA43DRAFT_994871 [Ganoderma leucocontextum]|nr:hypothetical protein LXA43DRAFT_994871 [Ganoderma leucocontextum]
MSSLMRVMFRSGTLYFIMLLVLNSFHVLFVFLPNSLLHVQFSNTSYFIRISEPLTAILVSHFMLDLHETNRRLAHQGSDLSTIQIMSVDIGQPYSRNPVSEELGDWSVAPNPTSSRTELEIWSESGEVGSSSIACTNGNTEVV